MTVEPRLEDWGRLSGLVAECLGLHFPPDRQPELERGIRAAAAELGYENTAACVAGLLASPPRGEEVQVLASHLTVGETYFFRDRPVMEALADAVLPELIRERRDAGRRLRIWSAACCSGEEAYTVAILLHRLLPDLRDWRVTIRATDVNPRFIRKAALGHFGEWSFRGAPEWLKRRYFRRVGKATHAVDPEIRAMVSFACLNLAKDDYPSAASDTHAMGLVLCRNVLMYFTPERMRQVAGRLHDALADGGWLAAGPSESSSELFPRLTGVAFPGAILFRKGARAAEPFTRPDAHAPARREPIESLVETRIREQALPPPRPSVVQTPAEPVDFSRRVRALANEGRHAEALASCERWIAADKLDPSAHYLHGIVLLEQGDTAQARVSLQRAIYVDPGFVLAHYALGNLARAAGNVGEADRHFANALQLLHGHAGDEPVPESDGLTAGRLVECITSRAAVAGAHEP